MLAELAVLTAALAAAVAATLAWLYGRVRVRAAEAAQARSAAAAAAFVEAARRFGAAARGSVAELRGEIDRALRVAAPQVDVVLIFDERDGALACVFAAGERAAYFAGTRLTRDGTSLPGLALLRGHRVRLAASGLRPFHPGDADALAIPFAGAAGRSTVVYVAARVPLATPAVDALATTAELAAFAYALAEERAADRQRAEYDALTGLLSPRAFRERLAALLEAARYAPLARFALLFVDTDRFKEWNDTFGHASGDALLRAIAQALRSAALDGDLVARNGGDEFCLVFAACEKSQALLRAERLRAALAALDLAAVRPPGNPAALAISASVGVAAYPADALTAADLLARADQAMYHSKRSGRNAVSYLDAAATPVRYDAATAAA